jgi:predicted RNA-binding protein Jag
LKLQDHGNPVRYRNIWYRPLRPRPLDGGTDGFLSVEATLVKRAEIAAMIREDAATLESMERAFRLLESLVYEDDESARAEANQLVAAYVQYLQGLSGAALLREKGTALKLDQALQYLRKFNFLEADDPALSQVRSIVDANKWRKRR